MAKEDLSKNLKKPAMTRDEIQQALIDNFISLQKVMTNLSVKFEELSTNMSRLLQLFETSAKIFAERYSTQELAPQNAIDTELINKLSILLDQNKLISKGIMMIEEKMREKNNIFEQPQGQYPYPATQQSFKPVILPSQQFQPNKKGMNERQNIQN